MSPRYWHRAVVLAYRLEDRIGVLVGKLGDGLFRRDIGSVDIDGIDFRNGDYMERIGLIPDRNLDGFVVGRLRVCHQVGGHLVAQLETLYWIAIRRRFQRSVLSMDILATGLGF